LRDIDSNLRRLGKTDDLSYAIEEEKESQPASGVIGETSLVPHRRLIDQETLSHLIEECREEEERRSIMHEMESG